tara:strand:- start:257 stop:1099 length:843 start_codon:yes stop_codon:yes gene_type:complete
MEILLVKQNTDQWLQHRVGKLTASSAPAIMGVGYKSRKEAMEDFLQISKPPEHSDKMKALFQRGHDTEAVARPLIEKEFNEVLAPITGVRYVDGMPLLASFDGLSFDFKLVWEHKSTGKKFTAETIPPLYYWQIEHQCLVAGTTSALLTVTDLGNEIKSYKYESKPERRDELIQGWRDFIADSEFFERDDEAYLDWSDELKLAQYEANVRNEKVKELKVLGHQLSGGKTCSGNGVTITTTDARKRQTPAQYVLEQEIELPYISEEVFTSYRITINKDKAL